MSSWDKMTAWIHSAARTTFNYSLVLWQWSYANARVIGWWVVTTGMITAFPLIFEVKREELVEELEQLRVSQGLAQGKTPQELAMSGLASAVEPKVL